MECFQPAKISLTYSIPCLDDYGQPHCIFLAKNLSLIQSMALLPLLDSAAQQ